MSQPASRSPDVRHNLGLWQGGRRPDWCGFAGHHPLQEGRIGLSRSFQRVVGADVPARIGPHGPAQLAISGQRLQDSNERVFLPGVNGHPGTGIVRKLRKGSHIADDRGDTQPEQSNHTARRLATRRIAQVYCDVGCDHVVQEFIQRHTPGDSHGAFGQSGFRNQTGQVYSRRYLPDEATHGFRMATVEVSESAEQDCWPLGLGHKSEGADREAPGQAQVTPNGLAIHATIEGGRQTQVVRDDGRGQVGPAALDLPPGILAVNNGTQRVGQERGQRRKCIPIAMPCVELH